MRTEKIKDNPTRIEELEWLLKCAKHYESGGKITTLIHQGSYDKSESDFKFNKEAKHYEIVLEPEYRPYKNEEEAMDVIGRKVFHKNKTSAIILYESTLAQGLLFNGCTISADILFENYTFEDGSPCGVEVEG